MSRKRTALVLGAGGFIGSHMVKRLKSEGYWVRGVDLKFPEFAESEANEFLIEDLSNYERMIRVVFFHGNGVNERGNYYTRPPHGYWKPFDEIYQFAADMGGAGYIFTGENDADIMENSALINLNLLRALKAVRVHVQKNKNNGIHTKVFYSSSACIYPGEIQEDPNNVDLKEETAYPANPDSEYGWEKLFSERLYKAFESNYGVQVRIARYHNIYGPEGTWEGGKEKAPAAICRKVAKLPHNGGTIDVWGDGEQTRSFLYIDDCIEATRRLMKSDCSEVINIGSEEQVSINQLVGIVANVANKEVETNHIDGPLGVRGRNSQNDKIREVLGWDYTWSLEDGIRQTYNWINNQCNT